MNQHVGGLSDIRTNQRIRVQSKPSAEGADYLEVYLMVKERQRLEGCRTAITESSKRTNENLTRVNREIARLQKELTRSN